MEWKDSLAGKWTWPDEIGNRESKIAVARQMADRARDGDVVGAGSGSTVYLTLLELARRIERKHIRIAVIAASAESAMTCIRIGIPLTTLWACRPDWCFDGTDEVDGAGNLLKGRGGALFREKLLIRSSEEAYILFDASKRVDRLGERFPVPVEVYPEAVNFVENRLGRLGATEVKLRPAEGKDGPLITENGNFIADALFPHIGKELEERIKRITGVVESGLFMGYPLRWVEAE